MTKFISLEDRSDKPNKSTWVFDTDQVHAEVYYDDDKSLWGSLVYTQGFTTVLGEYGTLKDAKYSVINWMDTNSAY